MRSLSVRSQLDGKPSGEGSLSGRGRSGNQDKFHLVSGTDLLRNPGNRAFLQCFGHQHFLPHLAAADGFVQIRDTADSHLSSPVLRLLLHLKQLGRRRKRAKRLRL